MPTVTFDGQSFSVRNRRVWLSAVEFDYALIPSELWRERLLAAAAAGFNAIVAPCPWSLHEPQRGRFRFSGSLDVGAFAALCVEFNLFLIARIGPSVGGTYDGGGLPAWLSDLPGVRMREPNPVFFDRMTRWWRALSDQLATATGATDVGATAEPARGSVRSKRSRDAGALLAVQLDDDWACGVPERADAYFAELARFAREVGFDVPLLTANQGWTSVDAATDTWVGWDDLTAATRQLAFLRPECPRIVTVRDPASLNVLNSAPSERDAEAVGRAHLVRLARVLAAGGQFVVGDALSVMHHGASAGERKGEALAALARIGAMFDESGRAIAGHDHIRRIASFASSFGHVLAQASVTDRPVVIDPDHAPGLSVVPLSSPSGTVLFVFAGDGQRTRSPVPLLLSDGRRMDVQLGTAPVAWFVLDADLLGLGFLNYASISPVALLERRFVVFTGPAGVNAQIEIDGVPLNVKVPSSGARPAIEPLKNLVVVVCNDEQWRGLRVDGDELVCEIGAKAVRIARDGAIKAVLATAPLPKAETATATTTTIAFENEYADGSSQRFATLDNPATLAACGAMDGCGWYRVTTRRASAGTSTFFAPLMGDRAAMWLDGTFVGSFGRGPGAQPFPVELKLSAGTHQVVLFVERLGRPVSGDHLARRSGLFGPLFEVRSLRATPKREHGVKANRFAGRGFVYGISHGELGAGEALSWKVPLKKSTSLLIDAHAVTLPATVLVDDKAIARIGGDGTEDLGIVVDASTAAGAVDSAVVRIVFDGDPDEALIAAAARSVRLYESARPAADTFAFARWAPPTVWPLESSPATKPRKRVPAWTRGDVALKDASLDRWLDVSPFVDGFAFVNGHAVGRFASTARGSASLFVPRTWLRVGDNVVVVFDSTGATSKSLALSTHSDARSS
ncbi:MAG: beta-galactosidase [Phycisphaerae bacterium]|nr:beta-galactosidase [Phycisphaerae bacterium]